MNFISEFLNQYGLMIIYAALTAVAGYFGTQLKKILQKREDNATKEKVTETCVKAVEQLYRDLNGCEKLQKAKENIVSMLTEKGISVSEIELDMLIESCVAEFNLSFLKEAKTQQTNEKEEVQ